MRVFQDLKFSAREVKSALSMLIRYGISGFSGIGANLLVFSFLVTYTDIWLVWASVFGFIAAYIVTFLMHKYWTFKNLSKELFYKQSVVYLFSAVATLIINTSVLYMLVGLFDLHPILAQFFSLLAAALLSFLFTTQITFHANASRIHTFTGYMKTGLMSFLLQHKNWVIALTLIMCVCVFVRLLAFPLTYTTDSEGYVATANLLLGEETATVYGERILKPLAPGVVAVFSLVGFSPEFALLLQALLLYFVLGWVVFWFGYELFKRPDYACALAIIVVTSYPIFRYGINYYTETGIWALYFATLAVIVRWMRAPSFQLLSVISMLLLLGLLWKEYAVLTGLIFALAILFQQKFSLLEKFHAFLQTGFLVLIPWGIWQYAVFHLYDYSYINWLAIGSSSSAYTSEYTLFNVAKTVIALLMAVWPLVFLGVYQWGKMSTLARRMLLLMVVPSFGFLLWGFVSSRLFFALVPLIAPLAVLGFMSLPNIRIKYSVVLLVLFVNSILTWLVFDPSVRMLLNNLS